MRLSSSTLYAKWYNHEVFYMQCVYHPVLYTQRGLIMECFIYNASSSAGVYTHESWVYESRTVGTWRTATLVHIQITAPEERFGAQRGVRPNIGIRA